METFGLKEEDCTRVVTDDHLVKFTEDYGEDWRLIHAYLELKSIVARDIDKKNVDERNKRFGFFTKWKTLKLSGATYERLVCALLKVGNRVDAEAVCEMLLSSLDSFKESPNPTTTTTPTGIFILLTLLQFLKPKVL